VGLRDHQPGEHHHYVSQPARRLWSVHRTDDARCRPRAVCSARAVRANERASPAYRCLPLLRPCVLLSHGTRSSASLTAPGRPASSQPVQAHEPPPTLQPAPLLSTRTSHAAGPAPLGVGRSWTTWTTPATPRRSPRVAQSGPIPAVQAPAPPLLLCCLLYSVAWLAPSVSSSGVECSRFPWALPAQTRAAGAERTMPVGVLRGPRGVAAVLLRVGDEHGPSAALSPPMRGFRGPPASLPPAISHHPQGVDPTGRLHGTECCCGVAAFAGSCLWGRLAEPEPDLRAALEDSPVVGELLDDPQPPAAVSAGLWTGR
jgi:hypothetical protein